MYENLLTIKQFAEKNKELNRWPFTEGSIRGIYWYRKKNSMEHAFIKIGGKILIDEEKFYGVIKSTIDDL